LRKNSSIATNIDRKNRKYKYLSKAAGKPLPKMALEWAVFIGIPCDSANASIISKPT